MINNKNDEKQHQESQKDDGYIDVVNVAVQAHILIKDKDTGEILLNKRG